ncbi:SDR family NAD(P)-dependent oxidoreductase, partial [Streptomyces sp. NPDC005827]|uniref:SDR family NAD(P)-dependent oxidoreductase n=1 Tax=Streptomyces sp. NPDC005827 TaxID=3157070 RepID=UPI0033CB73AE
VVAANPREAAEALEALAAGERGAHAVPARRIARHRPKVALVFPGQGSQWAGMGRRLALTVPEFREAVREADAAIARHLGRSLWSDEHGLVAESTAEVQPALFAMQVALAETWRAWGLRPAAVIGHSMGEIAAAQAAGALTLADAAAVVCERSRLLTEISGLGGLVLVELGEEEAAALIAGRERDLSVAALNGPRATVLSGTLAALDDMVARLDARGVFARRISVEFAAHSPQVEPLQPRLRAALSALAARDTEVALYSTVTGEAVRGHELGPDYWVTNVRAPVRFGPALGRLLADGCDTFVEIAPHPVLARPVADRLDETGRADTLVVSSLRRDEDEPRSLLTAVGNLYTAGVPVDWSALHPGTARHTPLARHGWRHQHFPIARLGEDRRRAPARRPGGRLLGARVPVGPEPALRLWELPLGSDTAPELLDHVVEDVPLVAGAYWLTAAAQAATAAAPGKPVALQAVSFAQPYPLDEERERPLQIGIRPGPDGREHFAVVSCPSEGRPVTHAEGVLGDAPGGAPPGPSEDLDAIRARCVTEVAVDDHYRRLAAAGLRYGPRFRALERLTVGDGEALARVRLPEGLDAGAPPLHPALLDSCLHTVAAATAEPGREDALPLPVGAETVWSATESAPLRTGWCHARLLDAGHRRIVADVTVLDDTGTTVWSATGFRVRLTAPRRRPEDGRLYEVRWTPYDSGPAVPDPGRWLLLADDASLGTAAGLAERLARAGARCETRRPGADSGFGDLTTAERDGPLRGIVDTRAAAIRPGATARDEAARTAAALEPVRAVTGGRWRHAAPRLWLLTAGTQDPTGVTGDELPAGAGLWGLGRTVGNEFPEPGCSLMDLDRDPAPRDLDAATAALLAAKPASQLAVRGGALTAPVLREAARDPLAAVPALRADRTYVLTGGLGELGMRVARRLAHRGARHLLLIGRGAPSDAAARHLAELRATGCETQVAQADVSDADSLRIALHGPRPGTGPARPPVGGVVHLAGVLADALLPDLEPRDLDRTFAGKAVGAWHLHELTREEPLEFFVLFSSLAGLIGSPGQGAYAAANSFLDALARRRAALGLPAHSIAWGTWAGASLAATGGGTDRLAARGVPPLEPGTGLELLDAALCGDRPQLAATALDPARLAAAGVWPSARELLAPLLAARQDELPGTAGARPGAVRAEILAAAAPAQRRLVMLDFLTDQVAQVLSARPGTVAADAPFHSMGLDSLMAIELRGRLESALGIRLSATLVYAHPTAGALADQLLSRLLPDDTAATGERDLSDGRGAAAVPPDDTAAPPDPDSGLAHLDDSEVAALLAAELDVFEANGEE